MKYFIVVTFVAGWLLAGSCNRAGKSSGKNGADADSLARTDSMMAAFFPVGDYLRAEILRVDSLPLAIVRYTVENGRRDSAFLSPPEFDRLAKAFLLPEFENGSFAKNYQESSFMDKSTRLATFTYSPADGSLPLHRVDVTTTPGNGANQVKSIYMEKTFTFGDTVVLQKMYWKAGHNFQIILHTNVHGKSFAERQTKVVWDADEDSQ